GTQTQTATAPTGFAPTGTIQPAAGYDTPTLTWTASTNVSHYIVYLADVTNPNNPIVNYVVVPGTATSYTESQGLTPCHSYQYNIGAASDNGAAVDWGALTTFTLGTLVVSL